MRWGVLLVLLATVTQAHAADSLGSEFSAEFAKFLSEANAKTGAFESKEDSSELVAKVRCYVSTGSENSFCRVEPLVYQSLTEDIANSKLFTDLEKTLSEDNFKDVQTSDWKVLAAKLTCDEDGSCVSVAL